MVKALTQQTAKLKVLLASIWESFMYHHHESISTILVPQQGHKLFLVKFTYTMKLSTWTFTSDVPFKCISENKLDAMQATLPTCTPVHTQNLEMSPSHILSLSKSHWFKQLRKRKS